MDLILKKNDFSSYKKENLFISFKREELLYVYCVAYAYTLVSFHLAPLKYKNP